MPGTASGAGGVAGAPAWPSGRPWSSAGCNVYPTYGASRGATKQGQETFKLYSGMMTTGIIVGGLVGLLILWTIIRYRKRSDEMPRQFHENVPIEILYTVIPVIIVAVLFFFTVLTENNVDAIQPVNATFTATGKPVVDITVTAFQWGWRFDYPDLNVGVAGETTNGPNNHGPQMVVPVGQTVQITAGLGRRHPRLLRAGLQLQPLRPARGEQPLRPRRAPYRDLQRPVHPDLRPLPLGDAVQRAGGQPGGVRGVGRQPSVATGHTLPRSGSSAQDNPPLDTHQPNGSGYNTPSQAKGDQ